MKVAKKIENYQLEELGNNRLFINKYDMSLKYSYELNIHWKELFFDIMNELFNTYGIVSFKKGTEYKEGLFEILQENYEEVIKDNHLKTDIRDYIELEDYISFDKWLEIEGNDIAFYEQDILLIKEM